MSGRSPSAFERALAFCRARRLFAPGDRVLVASGSGAASLGVLGFLRLAEEALRLGEVAVGAVDHGSEDDAEAVADVGRFARGLGATFYAVSADGRRTAQSVAALARREGFDRVALGHTRDDAVARVLAGLLGGRGARAVRPYCARRRDGFVRPLLELREAEALELARTAGIEPTALPPDPTARVTLQHRLRARVLPRLRVEVPDVDAALLRLGAELRQLDRVTRAAAIQRLDAAQVTASGMEIPVRDEPAVLSAAVATEALSRMNVESNAARGMGAVLARMLRNSSRRTQVSEVVLGSGLVATYLPSRRVVALRVMKLRRAPDEVIG